MTAEILRCTLCRHEVSQDEARRLNLEACPDCGSHGTPMKVSDDATVEVNWHELRILCIWAEFWANAHSGAKPDMQRTVNVIAGRIHAQHPEKLPLTFSGEIAEVRREFGDSVEVYGFTEDPGSQPREGS